MTFKLNDVGEVIASRKFALVHDPSREIVVKMGRPQKIRDRNGYYCPIQILGAGDEGIYSAVGYDAFQAIELAFRLINLELELRLGDVKMSRERIGDISFAVPGGEPVGR
ncbi:MAG: hypothetical protein ACE14L_11725 [Terriglobales bacterium]